MNILIYILTGIHVLVALFLIVLVLAQKSKDQGVGAAFGGGVTESVFGGSTTPLVRMTIWCGCILLVTTLSLAMLQSHRTSGSSLIERALQKPAPAPSSSSPLTLPAANAPSQPESTAPSATTPSLPPVESTGAAAPSPQP